MRHHAHSATYQTQDLERRTNHGNDVQAIDKLEECFARNSTGLEFESPCSCEWLAKAFGDLGDCDWVLKAGDRIKCGRGVAGEVECLGDEFLVCWMWYIGSLAKRLGRWRMLRTGHGVPC